MVRTRVRAHPRRLRGGRRTAIGAHTRNRSLGVGHSTFTGTNLKIHRYSGSLRITDQTHAGKRGKKVGELTVIPATRLDDTMADQVLQQAVASILADDYPHARERLQRLATEHGLFTVQERALRGIDVEPTATAVRLERTFPDGTSVRLTASPHDFSVISRVPHGAPGTRTHHFQDTLYSPEKKADAQKFYAWLSRNVSVASHLDIDGLRQLWRQLGVGYDYH